MAKQILRFSLSPLLLLLFYVFVFLSPEKLFKSNDITDYYKEAPPPFLADSTEWVDSVFNSLSDKEKISQLLMVAAYPNAGQQHFNDIDLLIKKFNIGGIIYFQGKPEVIAKLTNQFQKNTKTPLLIAIDAEWGLSMRIENTLEYPKQMMLGSIEDDNLIYQMGADLAMQLKSLGIHVNFAPVVDINNNPDNPVINYRSFGEDKYNVTSKGLLYMKGLQDNGIIAVAKHFPGHGNTNVDSHKALPVLKYSRESMNEMELYPFKGLIYSGVGGVMVAHLNIPVLDSTPNLASTLSEKIVTRLLKNELGFEGLIFTDAMNMGGVSKYHDVNEACVKALIAGNDIILMPEDIKKTVSMIGKAVRQGKISQEEIDNRCKKVLKAKYWVGLNQKKEIDEKNILQNLNRNEYSATKQKLVENSLTLIHNDDGLVPFHRLDTLNFASIAIGTTNPNDFQKTLQLYANVDLYQIDKYSSVDYYYSLIKKLSKYNVVFISLHNTNTRLKENYGIKQQSIDFIDSISQIQNVVLVSFANPYALKPFQNLENTSAILISYEDNKLSQSFSAQLLFGGIPAKGKLPVSINRNFRVNDGVFIEKRTRLKYGDPLEVGLNDSILMKIDSIVTDAINKEAFPGCQVLIAKQGSVIKSQSYGFHTYRKINKVENDHLYDIASLTKIIATTPSIMKMFDEDKLHLNDKLSQYLPELDTTNKKDITVKETLIHQAGLKGWIPFYINTVEPLYPNQKFAATKYSATYPIKIGKKYYVNKHLKYRDNYFSSDSTSEYPVKIAQKLYMNKFIQDTIYHAILNSELREKKDYHYSDLGFYLFKRILDDMTGMPLNEYVDHTFYKKLGANTLGYFPLQRFEKERIAPTENDLIFRKQVVRGYVHDPGAAMLGGVGGHAGLFSNANDLAKFLQMYLQLGEYGGIRYLNKNTIKAFTSCIDCKNGNRRGLGFDKPQPDTTKFSPAIINISPESYGHTGFTGTMVWVDPEYDIIYIFLSNRVYPDAVDNKLAEMNIRTKIQQVIYDAVMK